ncbi:hypothetical protein LX36DRAFT_590968 [Colletotrichum falcatum]|nr:hypothetical protein LX36DRAFT_590968 [Colletotrichum falcatum]
MRLLGLLACLLTAWHVNAFTFDSVFWVDQGDWKCSKAQLKILNRRIDEARAAAQSAARVLSASKSEDSQAFRTWFGESKRPERRPGTRDWQFPRMPRQRGPGVTENSLVYACPPAQADNYCANANVGAAVHNPRDSWGGPTLTILCPPFFASTSTVEDETLGWRMSGRVRTRRNTGLTLIHEFQHMNKVTGYGNVCTDVSDPSTGRGCYSADWYVEHVVACMRISDSQKIKNAENYALFAGYIQAWPEKARPL